MLGFWTDARVEQLKALWVGGDSASAIGREMGTTRCAILGKVHRLGLEGRKNINDYQHREPTYKSVFKMRERKPPPERRPTGPAPITFTSAITGAFITKRKPAPQPELTKNQLRAELTQALINTGGVAV